MTPFTVPVPNGTLAGVRRGGDGVPLVLAHGFGGSHADWRKVIEAFTPSRSVIAYDLRGFGASTANMSPYSHAEDLAALLDALEIAAADICGLSLGGGAALSFAIDSPDRARHLVLVSPLINGWAWSQDWINRWKAIGRLARAREFNAARELWWAHPLFDQVRRTSSAADMRAAIDGYHGAHWVEDNHKPVPSDRDRLGQLSVPTLLMTGDEDTADFLAMADAIALEGANVTHRRYAGAGHMLNLEISGLIAAEIERFTR